MQDCIFCAIVEGKIPSRRVVETDNCIVINDIAPQAPIHQLIIPKKHLVDLREFAVEDLALGSEIFAIAQQLSANNNNAPFRLIISNGHQAGQRVFHTHVHFLAGKEMAE